MRATGRLLEYSVADAGTHLFPAEQAPVQFVFCVFNRQATGVIVTKISLVDPKCVLLFLSLCLGLFSAAP